jgi:alkylhydroperoxidase family enzyme
MALIPYLKKDQVSPEYQDLMTGNHNAFRALAHSPGGCRQFRNMVYYLKTSKLDPRLRELAMIQVGWLSGCEYEWCHHVDVALASGVTEQDIRSLMEGTEEGWRRLGETEYMVLLATRQMYTGPADADVVHALRSVLGEERLVDLMVLVGFYIGAVRVLGTLGIDLEAHYEQYRTRFPLRGAAVQ